MHGESFAPISTLEVNTEEDEQEKEARRQAHPLFKGHPVVQVKAIYDGMVTASPGDSSEIARRARMGAYTHLVDVLKVHLDAGVGAVHERLSAHLDGDGPFHTVGSAAQAGHATLMNALGYHGSAAAQEALRNLASAAGRSSSRSSSRSSNRSRNSSSSDTIKITVESANGEDVKMLTATSTSPESESPFLSWGDMHPTVLHLTQVALANLADVRDPSDETIAALEAFAGQQMLPADAPSWAVALRKHAVTVLGKLLGNLLAYRADEREEDIARLEQWIRGELHDALGDLEDDGVYANEAHRAGLYSPAGERCQGLLAAIENSGDRFFLPLVAGILSRGDVWKKTTKNEAKDATKAAPLKLGMDFASAVIRAERLREGEEEPAPVASESSSWRSVAPGAVAALRHMEGTHVDHLLESVLEATPTDRGIAGSVTTQHMRHNALGVLEKRMPPAEVTERVANHVFDLKKWAGRSGLETGYAKFFASVARTPHAEGVNAATEAMRVMLQRAGALDEKLEAAAARATAAEDARRGSGLALLEASAAAGRAERLSRALAGLTTASSTCAQKCSACGIASNRRNSGVQCGAPDAKYQKCIAATTGGRALPHVDQSKKCGSKAAPGCWSTYTAETKLLVAECKRGKCMADYALMKTEAEFLFGCTVATDLMTDGNKAETTTPAPSAAETKVLKAEATKDAAAMAMGGSDAFMAIVVAKVQKFLLDKGMLDEIKNMEKALLVKLPTSDLKMFSLVSPEERAAAAAAPAFIEVGAETQMGASAKKCGQGEFDLECFATSLLRFPREVIAGFEAVKAFDFFQCVPTDAVSLAEFAKAVQTNLDTELLSTDVLVAVSTLLGGGTDAAKAGVIKSLVKEIGNHATKAITPLNGIVTTVATLASGTISKYQAAAGTGGDTLAKFSMNGAIAAHLEPIKSYVTEATTEIKAAVAEMKQMMSSFGTQTGQAGAGSAAVVAKRAIIAAALKTLGERCGMPPTLVDTANLLSKIKKAIQLKKVAVAGLKTKAETRAALRETIKVLVLESRLVDNAFAAFTGLIVKMFPRDRIEYGSTAVTPRFRGGCLGGELLTSTNNDAKTLAQCAKYAADLKAGMFSFNPPDQHCVPFTAEQCRIKGFKSYGEKATYTLYESGTDWRAQTGTKILSDLIAQVRVTLIKTPQPGSHSLVGGSSDLFAVKAKELVAAAKKLAVDGAAVCTLSANAAKKSDCTLLFAMVQQGITATESFAAVMKLVPEEMSVGAAKVFGLALVKSVKEARTGLAETLQGYYNTNKSVSSQAARMKLVLKLINALQGDFGGEMTQKAGMSKFMAVVRSIEEDFLPVAKAAKDMLDPTVNLVTSLGATLEALVNALKEVTQFDSKVYSCIAKDPVGGMSKWGPTTVLDAGKKVSACGKSTKTSKNCKKANKLLDAAHDVCAGLEVTGQNDAAHKTACQAHTSTCQWSNKSGKKRGAKYWAKIVLKAGPKVCAQAKNGAKVLKALQDNFTSLSTAVQTHLGKKDMAGMLTSAASGVGSAAMPVNFVESLCDKVAAVLPSKDVIVKLVKDAVLTSPQVSSLFNDATMLLSDSLGTFGVQEVDARQQ